MINVNSWERKDIFYILYSKISIGLLVMSNSKFCRVEFRKVKVRRVEDSTFDGRMNS